MRRLIILSVGLVALLGILFWLATREVPVIAELVELAEAPMEVTVDVDGTARIREVYEVSSPINGTAMRSPVRVGDEVIGGQTVVAVVRPVAPALLDARSRLQAEAALEEAEAALRVADGLLRQAEEDLEHARLQFTRVQELVERGVATLTRLEDAQQMRALKDAAHDVALSSRDMARSAVERAKALLIGPASAADVDGVIELKAPVSGKVLSIAAVSERPVAAGALLLTLGSPGDLEITATPLSQDAVRIPAGAKAYVERWGGEPLQAELRLIDPSGHTEVSTLGIEEQRVDAWFDLREPDKAKGLSDSYAVHLRIVIWESPAVLQVPLGAVFRDGEDWAVYLVINGRASKAVVGIGQRGRTTAEVTQGLKPGDQVISHPSDKISEGTLIEVLAVTP
jgi:HlyD family secretion protein